MEDKKKKEIDELWADLKPEIDAAIEKYIPPKVSKGWLEFVFGKANYRFSEKAAQKSLIDPIRDFLGRGGKRWRPILFLLLVESAGGDVEKVKELAVIPELVHNGTLIIDDIEDEAVLRRGKPALHRIFGVDMAVNAGNFIYFLPLLAFRENKDNFKPEVLTKAYEVYIQEMINLSLGQGTDIYWHKGKADHITEDEYFQMCSFKTGCLTRMAAKMAVILAGGKDELTEKVGRLAEVMGIAFQIQDDILDISLSGTEREKFGKTFGNDIKEGKRTLMVIDTLKKAESQDRKRLIEILNKNNQDLKEIKEAITIINKYQSIDYAQRVARRIVGQAWQEADKLLPPTPAKQKLKVFINYLIERKT